MSGRAAVGVVQVKNQCQYAVFAWVPTDSEAQLRACIRLTAHLLYLRDRITGRIQCDDE